jgi:hypothetical protein
MRPLSTILLFAVMCVANASAQPHSILKSFIAFQQEDVVVLRWVIAGGNQCAGTTMFRSEHNDVFSRIGHIEGICGNTDADETYTFVDSTALPNVNNYYKLEMGLQGFTTVVQLFFEQFGDNDVLVSPNHTDGPLRILFSNPNQETADLTILDRGGRPILTRNGSGSEFNLDLVGLSSGMYYFHLTINGKVKTGKFFKL